jgi:hypothetical protein
VGTPKDFADNFALVLWKKGAHPGAAAFIDDHMQSFFDKYSDFIYLGIMLLSGLGSGAASWRSAPALAVTWP